MDNSITQVETRPAVPYPSKAKCAKILKDTFGPKTRYQTLDGNRLAVIEYVDGRHERHLVEVEAQAPEGRAILYWAAFVSAFKAIGYTVERHGKDGKIERLEMIPIWSKHHLKRADMTPEQLAAEEAKEAAAELAARQLCPLGASPCALKVGHEGDCVPVPARPPTDEGTPKPIPADVVTDATPAIQEAFDEAAACSFGDPDCACSESQTSEVDGSES